jgi:transcription elongation factor GreA
LVSPEEGFPVPPDIHRITQETLDKLKAEFEELTTAGRVEIARIIEAARLLGDLSENGDYHAAKDHQGKMESRIRQIDQILRNHEIIAKDESSNVVVHASIVSVIYDGDSEDDAQEFFIGSIEEKPEGVLVASPSSPLGAALLGKAVGDDVAYDAPSGTLHVKIIGLR